MCSALDICLPSSVLRRPATAFTLIELLVVIGIIAILAAMILAVTNRAKNSASKATDINNLHQIMIALHTYAGDNADVLPLVNWDNGHGLNGGAAHRGWLYLPDLTATGTNVYHADTGSLWEFLKQPKIYLCPMDRPWEPHYSDHDGAVETRQQQLSSYAMNGAVNGFMYYWEHPDLPYTKLGAMQPGDCAFWETDETDPWFFNDGANNPKEGVSGRHHQGAIQAQFDASVSYVKLDAWYNDVDFTNKNRLWCFPGSSDGRDPE
ncbi:MAG TPA: type II secretion system protein [Desulfuromonadaceae bacterium]|nr:type II secretion system protein [Desulfuromonadaceae bacterium]